MQILAITDSNSKVNSFIKYQFCQQQLRVFTSCLSAVFCLLQCSLVLLAYHHHHHLLCNECSTIQINIKNNKRYKIIYKDVTVTKIFHYKRNSLNCMFDSNSLKYTMLICYLVVKCKNSYCTISSLTLDCNTHYCHLITA